MKTPAWWQGLSPDEVLDSLRQRTAEIASYQNGGYRVIMFEDGTKVRIQTSQEPPLQPEQIDLKITDRCGAACPFCYEGSTPQGELADMGFVMRLLSPLKRGTEIAIGGGDVFSHPQLPALLQFAKERGILCNLTLNEAQWFSNRSRIENLSSFIYGVGYTPVSRAPGHAHNLVIHFIVGIHPPEKAIEICQEALRSNVYRALLLGYKIAGRGDAYYRRHWREIRENVRRWREMWFRLVEMGFVVAMDERAYWLLGERWKGPEVHDGEFNMYIDAVRKRYAPISGLSRMFPICLLYTSPSPRDS